MPIKNIVAGQLVSRTKVERARELRKSMTPTERVLWNELRGSKLGMRFRRQQVISGFIVDFYCHKCGLVIELDGDIHQSGEQKDVDEEKDLVLRELGLRVVRFHNEDVNLNMTIVLEKIRELISKPVD